MALHRKENAADPCIQDEVQVEDSLPRIRLKGKNKSAKSKRNRSPGRLAPAPVSKGNSKGGY